MAQSASDLARRLYSEFQRKAAPAVSSALGNVGNFIRQDIQRTPIVRQINTVSQVAPQIQSLVKLPTPQPINYPSPQLPKPIVQGLKTVGGILQRSPTLENIQLPQLPLIINNPLPRNPVDKFITNTVLDTPRSIGRTLSRVDVPFQQRNAWDKLEDVGNMTAFLPVGKVGATFSKQAQYLNKVADKQAIQKIMDFVIDVQRTGGMKNYGQLGQEIQAMAMDVFGPNARNLSNKQLANVFDATLKSLGQKKNRLSLGLAVEDVRGGKPSLSIPTNQTKKQAIGSMQQPTSGKLQSPLGKTATGVEGILPTSATSKIPSGGIIPDFDPQAYIKELTGKQKTAGESGPKGFVEKGRNLLSEIKAKLVDSVSPIEDALSAAEKKYKFQVRPTSDVRPQIDRVLRAKSLAAQFAKDNGFEEVIKNAPDLNALDQYMIAKQAGRVSELGKKTGRDTVKDQQLIQVLGPQYEQLAQTVNQYSRKLLDYSVEAGLIDKKMAQDLIVKYPDYVPLQRVFNEVERGAPYKGSTKAVASLSKQSVVQKLEGSEREIASPIESLLLKTQTAFEQGEKNKAARMLAGYKDLPGFEKLLKEVPSGQSAPHTISFLDNGVKRIFETTPEIAAAAKNLNQEQMNIVLRMLSLPTRVLQLGATGLNIPFVVTNIAKDQMTAFVNSNKAAKTSLLNPFNFARALFSAVKHDKLYDEVVRQGGMQTSFDISRSQPNLSVAKLRSGKSLGSKVKYTATHPQELLRALENVVGRAEEATRIQQYRGTYQALIKENRTPQDARILAAKAARENTANFARKGDIGKVVNYLIPFFNASIQGARVLMRNAQTRPLETGTKIAVGIFAPVAATTAWNLNDPQRKAIYEDIDEFEKQNNLILIPDGATKDEKGRYNVIKIPLPPGLSNLGTIVRRTMEQANGLDPVRFSEIANNLINPATGQNIDVTNPLKTIGGYLPQAVKPAVESLTNTNLFTGLPIVPQSLQDLPVTEQAKSYTSGTARAIGRLTNEAPLKVENFIKTAGGGVGSQLMNASDTVLNKLGIIPEEQVGGESAGEQLERRFRRASGGAIDEKDAKDVTEIKEKSALDRYRRKQTAEKLYTSLKQMPPEQAFKIYKQLKESDPLQFKALTTHIENEKLGLTYRERSVRDLTVEDYARAKFIAKEFAGLTTNQEKAALWDEWVRKKIITKDVIKQLNAMKKRGEL